MSLPQGTGQIKNNLHNHQNSENHNFNHDNELTFTNNIRISVHKTTFTNTKLTMAYLFCLCHPFLQLDTDLCWSPLAQESAPALCHSLTRPVAWSISTSMRVTKEEGKSSGGAGRKTLAVRSFRAPAAGFRPPAVRL